MIIFLFDTFSINRLVALLLEKKRVKTADRCFSKPKMTSLNPSICPQSKDLRFTITEEDFRNFKNSTT